MSNADRIRNMSDEELAEFFDRVQNQDREDWSSVGCYHCIYKDTHHADFESEHYECGDCCWEDGIIGWLKSEDNWIG